MTKIQLYAAINNIRTVLDLHDGYPINSKHLASRFSNNLILEEHNFSGSHIGGVLMKGEKQSIICLNSHRDEWEQNFDCMHELFHYWIHPPNTYTCLSIPRNSYLEWEANEGAAEMLVPYYKFIPEIYDVYCYINNDCLTFNYLNYFSEKYFVTQRVIELRIKSLSYEIMQYVNGVPLNNIQILSKQAQNRLGLNVLDFSVHLDFGGIIEGDAPIGNVQF